MAFHVVFLCSWNLHVGPRKNIVRARVCQRIYVCPAFAWLWVVVLSAMLWWPIALHRPRKRQLPVRCFVTNGEATNFWSLGSFGACSFFSLVAFLLEVWCSLICRCCRLRGAGSELGVVRHGTTGIFGRVRVLAGFGCFILRACPCTGLCANIYMFDSEAFEVARCLTSLAGLFFFDRASALDQLA